MSEREDRIKLLHEAAAERILVIGGPYGTYLHGRDLTAEDYGGCAYEGCPEQLNVTRPDVIADAHRGYLEAGADIIATNTFGGGSIVLAEYGLEDRVREINEAAARLSRERRGRVSARRGGRASWRATWGRRRRRSRSRAASRSTRWWRCSTTGRRGWCWAASDLLVLETQNDTRTIKAALIGIRRLFARDRVPACR